MAVTKQKAWRAAWLLTVRCVIDEDLADSPARAQRCEWVPAVESVAAEVHDAVDPWVPSAVARAGRAFGPPISAAAFYRQYRQLNQADTAAYEHLLDTIDIPITLVWGRDDEIVPTRYGEWIEQRVHNRGVTWIDAAGYLLAEDAPAQLIEQLISRWATQVLRPRATTAALRRFASTQ